MATNKRGETEQENAREVPTTEQLLARVYPLASGSRIKVEPKATDLCRVRLKKWLRKKNNGQEKTNKKCTDLAH
jgi:hypothetical protein